MTAYWTSRSAPWIGVALAIVAFFAVALFVDLSPRVEGEFFFADDDPQMRASQEVAQRFPAGSQMILRVEGRGLDAAEYRSRIAALTTDLVAVDGVQGAVSITTDPADTPLFRRILLTPDPDATNVVLQVDGADPERLLPRIEAVTATYESAELGIVISGVPAIVELIRRSLYRDLIVFSAAAVVVFALLIGIVYRDAAVVVGTLATCFVAVAVTLLVVQGLQVGIGLLTANLVTIVFVLTLSHLVFLTGNWRGASEADRAARLDRTLRDTWEGSFWSMATTLLGFASLLIATARPLRELGLAGVIGSLTALIVAYLVYPGFLGAWVKAGAGAPHAPPADAGSAAGATAARGSAAGGGEPATPLSGRWIPLMAGAIALALLAGVPRIDTDPGLLTYFDRGSELREGLARIDADGGSSTLDVVVSDPAGGTVSAPNVFVRLEELQASFEADSAVGVVLSPAVLIEQARTIPLAGLLPVGTLLDMASSERFGGIGRGFVTPDRSEARFSLRMRETVDEPRRQVIQRLRERVEAAGLTPVVIAGLYDLQAQLGRLIASSLRLGIGGLLLLFVVIAGIVSRSAPLTVAMSVCLTVIPVTILGAFGWAGVSIDIITSPAANIALAIGADSMIHLVVRVRRLTAGGHPTPWVTGVSQIGRPVLGATTIVSAGFGIFALSSFPPTQRFGFAVIVGTLAAAAMALLVLPRVASPRRSAA